MKKLPYSPVAFGNEGSAALTNWLRHACLDGRDVIPITDLFTDLPTEKCYRVNTAGMPFYNHPLNKADWIRALVADVIGEPVLACDTDWIPLEGMEFEVYLEHATCALCPDAAARSHPVIALEREHNTGICLFKPGFARLYKEHWENPFFQLYAGKYKWSGQICSSLVWKELNGVLMPEAWNRSHWNLDKAHLGPPRAIHYHGNGKNKIGK